MPAAPDSDRARSSGRGLAHALVLGIALVCAVGASACSGEREAVDSERRADVAPGSPESAESRDGAPDCPTVADHVIAIARRGAGANEAQRAAMDAAFASARAEIVRRCNTQAWPDQALKCLIQTEDPALFSTCDPRLATLPNALPAPGSGSGTASPDGAGPATLDDPAAGDGGGGEGGDATGASAGDPATSPSIPGRADCEAAVANFTRISRAEIARAPADERRDAEVKLVALAARLTAKCKADAWSEQQRRCLATAATHEALAGCSADLVAP